MDDPTKKNCNRNRSKMKIHSNPHELCWDGVPWVSFGVKITQVLMYFESNVKSLQFVDVEHLDS